MLSELLAGWRSSDPALAQVRLWSVGWAGQGAYAGTYAQGVDTPCFSDPTTGQGSVFALYGAVVDDLFVIDSDGLVRYHADLREFDLTEAKHRNALDRWVRDLATPSTPATP